MYGTIEPRLIALAQLELPPLNHTHHVNHANIVKPSGRPLLLEPDASQRNGKSAQDYRLGTKHSSLIASLDEDESTKRHKSTHKGNKPSSERALGNSSPQSLRKILDDGTDSSSAISSKKRSIVDTSKDDFVQLPQPPKKQKAAKQVVPPIILPLVEPPEQATLFPPIAASSFYDSHGRNTLNTTSPSVGGLRPNLSNDSLDKFQREPTSTKTNKRKQTVRPRKKWTEEETNNLLLGVNKHGVGNWADILDDPDFTFNSRSGSDLKDRFRTCCPAEMLDRSSKATESETRKPDRPQVKSRSSLMSENILIQEEGSGLSRDGSDSEKPHKVRAHRKKYEDLVKLGIEGPFQKSLRRERRPFSEDEDRAILEGYEIYGPVWTRIQRDTRFNLQSRKPTDLRDRFRNKYPDRFKAGAVKGSKETSVPSSTSTHPPAAPMLEGRNKESIFPTMSQSLADILSMPPEMDAKAPESLSKERLPAPTTTSGLRIREIISLEEEEPQRTNLQPQNSIFNNFNTFPDQSTLDPSENLPFTQSYDWNQGTSAPFSNGIGEMDISRLLLDEPWPELPSMNGKEKQSFTDINSILTSSAEQPLHNVPSFLNMLNDTDQIDDMNEGPFG